MARLLFSLSILFAAKLSAAGLGMPGPELNMLQRMQGQWQRHCYPWVDGSTRVYRRDFLTIDYMRLHFVTKLYTDDGCSKLRTNYTARTRFVLTGEFQRGRSSDIFALNAELQPPMPPIFKFPGLNVVSIVPGKLYFGRDLSGESDRGERLTRLDTNRPFLRH